MLVLPGLSVFPKKPDTWHFTWSCLNLKKINTINVCINSKIFGPEKCPQAASWPLLFYILSPHVLCVQHMLLELCRRAQQEGQCGIQGMWGGQVRETCHSCSNKERVLSVQKDTKGEGPWSDSTSPGVNIGICILPCSSDMASKGDAEDWSMLLALGSDLRGIGEAGAGAGVLLLLQGPCMLWGWVLCGECPPGVLGTSE